MKVLRFLLRGGSLVRGIVFGPWLCLCCTHTSSSENEAESVWREEYEKLQQAIRDMDMGFLSVDEFIDQQIRNLLEKHEAWVKEK
jgi:hypothetical protein